MPPPTCPAVATFRIPLANPAEDDVLRIRTFLHHSEVGVAKVWEAGACLAEYLLRHPHRVRDRHVVELGAGVGLTGLVAAGVARARLVHMTDYTEACLDNLAHNVHESEGWLRGRNVRPETVTVVSRLVAVHGIVPAS